MNTRSSQVQMKPLFIRGPSLTLRLLLLAIVSIVLMTLDHRQQRLGTLRATLSTLIYPVQYLVNLPFIGSKWLADNVSAQQTLVKDKTSLLEENLLLKAKLLKFASLETENMRLRALLQSSQRLSERMLIAEILAVDVDPFRHKITINKGSRHGVQVGQPLLDSEGIMGQIAHVNPFSSTALLITDPSHALPVQINRNGLRALVIGTGSFKRLDVPYMAKNADVRVGDVLISSGLGGRFPPDYPVARITSVERDPTQPFAKISAEPSARLESSREVLLVWPEQTGPLEPTPAAGPATPALSEPGRAGQPAQDSALNPPPPPFNGRDRP